MYWTIKFTFGSDTTIQQADYITDNTGYAEWCKDLMMKLVGDDKIVLPHIKWLERPTRKHDGMFNGSNNQVFIITDEEKNYYIQINNQRAEEKAEMKRNNRIEYIKTALEQASKSKIYETLEEAIQAHKDYNDLHNEGGDGYIPHMWTRYEIEMLNNELEKAALL